LKALDLMPTCITNVPTSSPTKSRHCW